MSTGLNFKRKFFILKNDYSSIRYLNPKGHGKLELRNNRLTLSINMDKAEGDTSYEVVLLDNGAYEGGKIYTDQRGRARANLSLNYKELEAAGFSFDRINGILILKGKDVLLGGYLNKKDGSIEEYIEELKGEEKPKGMGFQPREDKTLAAKESAIAKVEEVTEDRKEKAAKKDIESRDVEVERPDLDKEKGFELGDARLDSHDSKSRPEEAEGIREGEAQVKEKDPATERTIGFRVEEEPSERIEEFIKADAVIEEDNGQNIGEADVLDREAERVKDNLQITGEEVKYIKNDLGDFLIEEEKEDIKEQDLEQEALMKEDVDIPAEDLADGEVVEEADPIDKQVGEVSDSLAKEGDGVDPVGDVDVEVEEEKYIPLDDSLGASPILRITEEEYQRAMQEMFSEAEYELDEAQVLSPEAQRRLNQKMQATNYVLSILRYFPYVEPFKIDLEGYNWWRIDIQNPKEDMGFLPYFSYIASGNRKFPLVENAVTATALMKKYGHYIFGLYNVNDEVKFFVYGVPGRFISEDHPQNGTTGFNTWYESKDGLGYWLLYIDPETGRIIYPINPMIPKD